MKCGWLVLLLLPVLLWGQEPMPLRYAKNFTITYTEAGKLVEVRNAWRGSGDLAFQYLLTDDPDTHPEAYPQAQRIQTPPETVVASSTTLVPLFTELGVLDTLVGISNTRFVTTPEAVERIASGDIQSMGTGATMNLEIVLATEPDVLFTSAIGDTAQDSYPALIKAGVPVVLTADYTEDHPLGRAEWIKFVAAFYNLEDEAAAIFDGIAGRYEALQKKAAGAETRPSVFFNVPWGGTWYMPGGASYKATLVKDAGGHYLWEGQDADGGSMSLAFETVYLKAYGADFWLETRDLDSLEALRQADKRYARFKAFREQQVYNPSKLQHGGGNAFYERGALYADEVLADLLHILHPEHLPEHELKYYKRLR